MAQAKKQEVEIDPKTGEVLNEGGAVVPVAGGPAFLADIVDTAEHDQQSFEQDDLIIPRVTILQDLSPQVKIGQAAYIEGAKAGMIFNTVSSEIMQSMIFVPAFYVVRYIAWKPRKAGGGLLDADVDFRILTKDNGFRQENPGKWIGKMEPKEGEDPVTVEVIKTGEWAGIAIAPNGSMLPVAISFPGSKAKIARKINSKIDLTEIEAAPGKFVKPLPYAHMFSLTTGEEPGPEGPYWNFVANHLGWNNDRRAFDKAKDLRESIMKGEASFSEVSDEHQ